MSKEKQGAVTLAVPEKSVDVKSLGTPTFTEPAPVATPVAIVLPAPVSFPEIDESDDIAPVGPAPVSVVRVKPPSTPGMEVRPNRPGEIVEYRYRCGCGVPLIGRITTFCEKHGQPQMTETCPKCGAPKAGRIPDPRNAELTSQDKRFQSPCACEFTKQEIDRFQVLLKHVLDGCPIY